jgi:Macrocin-O-methyltransferase (TylF)
MMECLGKRLRRLPETLLKLPFLVSFVASRSAGREYGIGPREKLRLVAAFRRNNKRVETLSSIVEHLELADALLRLPRSAQGVVVECGCYRGGSTVNLSLVCAIVGRKLVVCDSFRGLPEPAEHDRGHVSPHHGEDQKYQEGQFAASLESVRENLSRYGELGVCEFKVGFFDESMRDFDEPVAMAFLDVDLIDSLRPCLEAIWPRLCAGGRVYVHEAEDLTLVSTFFDRDWWRQAIGEDPPGFVGAGSGLPLTALRGSDLGYALKLGRPAVEAT